MAAADILYWSICLCISYLCICPSIYLLINLFVSPALTCLSYHWQSINLSLYRHLSTYVFNYTFFCLSINQFLFIYRYIYIYIYICIYVFFHLCHIYLFMHLSISLSVHLSIDLSIFIKICMSLSSQCRYHFFFLKKIINTCFTLILSTNNISLFIQPINILIILITLIYHHCLHHRHHHPHHHRCHVLYERYVTIQIIQFLAFPTRAHPYPSDPVNSMEVT